MINKKKITINIFDCCGSFAENKDEASEKREEVILPSLRKGQMVILDYEKVTSTTQSFTHALISEAMREFGPDEALDNIIFKNCEENVKRIIGIVVEYMQKRLDA